MIVRKFLPIVPCDAATPMIDIFSFLILILLFFIFFMESSGSGFSRRLSLPSSSNPTPNDNERERKRREREAQKKKTIKHEMDLRVVDEITRYLSQYEREIVREFPKAGHIVGTPLFMKNLQEAILADQVPSNCTLTLLREAKSILFKDLNDIDSFRGNSLYSSLVILLREYR
jgi:hypothetical protein